MITERITGVIIYNRRDFRSAWEPAGRLIRFGELPKIVLSVSKNILKTVAGFVWFSGAVVLLLKGASLFAHALALKPGESWSWLAVAAAVLIGAVKARYLFNGFCRKNLDRIAALDDPQLWQAFRPGFYVFLATMVLLGAILSKLAIGNYPALIALVILDISIAIALLGSIRVFVTYSRSRRSLEN